MSMMLDCDIKSHKIKMIKRVLQHFSQHTTHALPEITFAKN